ncbi:vacuolar ATP synthase subunit E [Pyronema omphalodes]|nr:vacuolar ATP synthase subunit E [Pyronema omphalodes]
MSRGLSTGQVAGELNKMVAFIRQEAEEKAREVAIKTDEEVAIERSRLFRAESGTIDANFERKVKEIERSQQIKKSGITNKTRLKLLTAKQELLENVFEHARTKLFEVQNDTERYNNVLKGLVLEGLFMMGEDSIQVRARPKDKDAVTAAIEQAKTEYASQSGNNAEVTIDESNALSDDCAGGVIISGSRGKITINNTLEERLRILQQDNLPKVRFRLFGENPNRKFHD